MQFLAAENCCWRASRPRRWRISASWRRKPGIEGYALLARMKEAAAQLETGDRTGAVAAYDALAADSGLDPLLRDVSSLKAAMLLFDTASADELKLRLNAAGER